MKLSAVLAAGVVGLVLMQPVQAQDELPAVGGKEGADAATPTPAVAPGKSADQKSAGTTIFGERESPIGLYITPWRDARPEQDIDRPARLLQDKMLPIDRAVFNRQVEYHEALAAELKRKGLTTPQSR